MESPQDPREPPEMPATPELPEVESPPPEEVLDDAQPAEDIVAEQPSVDDLLGGDR